MATLAARLADLETAAAFEAAPSLTFSRYNEFDGAVIAVAEFGGNITQRLPHESLEALISRAPSARLRHLIYSD
jgi:hypothetical protein